MKKYLLFLLLPFLAFFVACDNDDDDDDRYVSIATVENPDNSSAFFLNLDNNKRLLITETNISGYRPKTGQRALVDYTLLNKKPDGDSYNYDIKLYDAYNILTKGIFEITPETQDSIGTDPIGIRDIWVGSDFLNVRFIYEGFNKVHYISLVKDDLKEYEDDKIHLELRHNAHDDANVYTASGIASFNLTSLLPTTLPTVVTPLELVIHAKRYDGSERTYEFEYNPQNVSEKGLDKDTFSEGKGSTIE